MYLSKSIYVRVWNCPKGAWITKHHPELIPQDEDTQARFRTGDEVGDLARGLFGPYVNVTAYKEGDKLDLPQMIRNTEEEMAKGTPVICEAAFSNYNNYCAVDILRKTESGYDFYEVKNAPEVYPQFIKDAGFQYYIMARCQVKIGKIFIVIHGPDEENPFVPVDVTTEAKGYYKWINDHIWDLNRMQKQPEEIEMEPGAQCLNPYECWYWAYCHDAHFSK